MVKRVVVGMSGGVDSSVAALLLKKQGYDVVGVTALMFDGPAAHNAIASAKEVCKSINIPHDVIDVRSSFQKYVIDYLKQEYKNGLTPNPCAMCNKHIKWGYFLEMAMKKHDAHYIATGHYAKIINSNGEYRLIQAKDEKKDQIYTLFTIKPERLSQILFPIADLTKEEIRSIAEENNLKCAKSKESQDVCFISPPETIQSYLIETIGKKAGAIINIETNKIVGVHDGYYNFTLGQRKGIKVAASTPLHVVWIDASKNTVYVGPKSLTYSKNLKVTDINWLQPNYKGVSFHGLVKVRYNSRPVEAEIVSEGNDTVLVKLEKEQHAITPGQFAVFYHPEDRSIIGGGCIDFDHCAGIFNQTFNLNKEKSMKLNTKALHAGQTIDPTTGSRAVPIYQTTSYGFEDSQHAANLFSLKEEGNIYTRIMNPTTDVLEKRIASLEGGIGALATASGQAAITYAVLNLAGQGDEIVASSNVYGGTYTLFAYTLKKLGITTHFVSSNDPAAFEQAITPKTKLIFAETISNPKLLVLDTAKLSDIAHKNGIPLIVDNTVASPYLYRPLEFGADIVVHSATKFLGGHGTSIGGLIVDSGNFDWSASGKFPEFTTPDPSYHGIIFAEQLGKAAYITKARVQLLRDMGAALSPFNAFLILQGIETLHLRMQRHSANALKVAKFLEKNDSVSWVSYPGLASHPSHELTKKYLVKGQGAIIGFGIKGGKESGIKFIDNVKLLSHLANIGDAKSLVIHPASTTHQQLTDEQRASTGITDDFIRLSIGIEDAEDIIEDINQALLIATA